MKFLGSATLSLPVRQLAQVWCGSECLGPGKEPFLLQEASLTHSPLKVSRGWLAGCKSGWLVSCVLAWVSGMNQTIIMGRLEVPGCGCLVLGTPARGSRGNFFVCNKMKMKMSHRMPG